MNKALKIFVCIVIGIVLCLYIYITDSSNINPILHTCETEPTASVYRCELEDTFSSRNWPVPFQEADMYVNKNADIDQVLIASHRKRKVM